MTNRPSKKTSFDLKEEESDPSGEMKWTRYGCRLPPARWIEREELGKERNARGRQLFQNSGAQAHQMGGRTGGRVKLTTTPLVGTKIKRREWANGERGSEDRGPGLSVKRSARNYD